MTARSESRRPAIDETIVSDDRLFWRNLLIVGSVHAVALVIFLIASWIWKEPAPVQVTWLGSAFAEGSSAAVVQPEAEVEPASETIVERSIPDPPLSTLPPPSDLLEPKQTPPAETPKPATPKQATPKPQPTPKPKPKTSPAPKPEAKTSAKPKNVASPKPAATVAPRTSEGSSTTASAKGTGEEENSERDSTGSGKGSRKTGSGGVDLSQFSGYFDMIHDRFYSRWAQPVGLGQDVIATLKLRINKDGTISNREMVRSSGNPQMDESVLRAAQKLEQIDPLPKGLGNGEYFDVNVNFKVGG